MKRLSETSEIEIGDENTVGIGEIGDMKTHFLRRVPLLNAAPVKSEPPRTSGPPRISPRPRRAYAQ